AIATTQSRIEIVLKDPLLSPGRPRNKTAASLWTAGKTRTTHGDAGAARDLPQPVERCSSATGRLAKNLEAVDSSRQIRERTRVAVRGSIPSARQEFPAKNSPRRFHRQEFNGKWWWKRL